MNVTDNYSLKEHNAFKVEVSAKHFAEIISPIDLTELYSTEEFKNNSIFILGEGYNTLFTKDFDGLVIKINILGIEVIEESTKEVLLEIGGGEDWINLVNFTLAKGWAGLENLSLIPGSMGAAPVQNIAAYGQNFEDIFYSLDAFNIENGTVQKFDKLQCKFGYRESVFKREYKNKFIITKVRIKLNKDNKIETSYHSRYGSLIDELEQFAKPPYTIKHISEAVIRIRRRKFPDWSKVGTAGSFFLNPIITKQKLKKLQKKVPEVQFYPVDKLTYPTPNDPSFDHANHVKVAAGWLLEELGWKGKQIGNVGTSPNQALVLINLGGATAKEILDFSKLMQEDFKKAYGIELEPEVNIV